MRCRASGDLRLLFLVLYASIHHGSLSQDPLNPTPLPKGLLQTSSAYKLEVRPSTHKLWGPHLVIAWTFNPKVWETWNYNTQQQHNMSPENSQASSTFQTSLPLLNWVMGPAAEGEAG